MEAVSHLAPKALRSGYGASDRQKRRDSSVKSLASPGERPQEIYTPSELVEPLREVWGTIELDPCWGPGSIVNATRTCYVPPRISLSSTGAPKITFQAAPDELDGLTTPWCDYTFVNPPFKYLEQWLRKAEHEALYFGHEIAVLCPARAHRKWFRRLTRSADAVIDLDPVKFVGYRSAFPVPLVLIYWGCRPSMIANAYAHLGDAR